MIPLLQNLVDNAEAFLNKIPETKGCHFYLRAQGDIPVLITSEGGSPTTKRAEIVIGMDNPHTNESRVLIKKEQVYDSHEHSPELMISILTQMILSDMISFSLGQTIMMYRRAELEGKQLIDKPAKEIA
jgi:hypothetical protein